MPPKIKTNKTDIIRAATEVVRKQGASALNARAVAAELNSSTQPIFSNYATMEELKADIIANAYDLYRNTIEDETSKKKYPPYKSAGMAYIRFAKEEKELFKLLFMRDRTNEPASLAYRVEPEVETLMSTTGFDLNTAERVHLAMWACVHGFGTMAASSYIDIPEEIASDILTDLFTSLTGKIKENKNEKDN